MTKTLIELQRFCQEFGLNVPPRRRAAKEPYVHALRDYFWSKENPGRPIPEQVEPTLLGDWNDLDAGGADLIERDGSGWCVQAKEDGVRVLLHIAENGVRITGRSVSEVTFRLSEFTSNVPHFVTGFDGLAGTILDGELVCPKPIIDTGDAVTCHPLQAAVAILATSPENAKAIQDQQDCRLTFVAFDVLRFRGTDTIVDPLRERLIPLERAVLLAGNPHIDLIETHVADKGLFHELVLSDGREGTVWKRLDRPYETGRRVRHWLKRKRSIESEAVVTGFKPGTSGKGNAHLVGAVEFGNVDPSGRTIPIAWVSNWTDEERQRMTRREGETITLHSDYLGRRAVIGGHDIAGRSGRYRHAKLIRWC